MRKKIQFALVFLGLIMTFLIGGISVHASSSVDYMKEMGFGWNLGNTFDGFDVNKKLYEESWGNPRVTKELLHEIKARGFTSIRLPFSVIDREDESHQIDPDFLNRYQSVVDMALDEGFYVMINLHHDSWHWLKQWDGQDSSSEFIRYQKLWEQLAERFKDYDQRLSFESINEPDFESGDKHSKLEAIDKAFHTIVRKSGGQNAQRMLIFPTILTKSEQEELDATVTEILSYQDPNIMATVHYYSEWVYSNNLGITGFDQVMWDQVTPRTSVEALYNRLTTSFVDKGIGVVIGEYGLLAFDRKSYNGEYANDLGELYKYVELMNAEAKETGISLMLWDNGQHFNRQSYVWHNPWLGEILTKSLQGRSAYGKGYWKSYVEDQTSELELPFEWNGRQITEIDFVDGQGLSHTLGNGNDYQVTAEGISLLPSFISKIKQGEYGFKGHLEVHFDGGAYWKQSLSYAKPLVLKDSTGQVGQVLTIQTDFNGEDLLYGQLHTKDGQVVSTNSWWQYLTYLDEWTPDAGKNEVYLAEKLTALLSDGQYRLTFGTYNGKSLTYFLTVSDGKITGAMEGKEQKLEEKEKETPLEEEQTIKENQATTQKDEQQVKKPEENHAPNDASQQTKDDQRAKEENLHPSNPLKESTKGDKVGNSPTNGSDLTHPKESDRDTNKKSDGATSNSDHGKQSPESGVGPGSTRKQKQAPNGKKEKKILPKTSAVPARPVCP